MMIDVLDLVSVVNIILGDYDPTDVELLASDINLDGVVDIIDIINLVNIILSI